MFSEIKQKDKYHMWNEKKKVKETEQIEWQLLGGGGNGTVLVKGAQTLSYKISKF